MTRPANSRALEAYQNMTTDLLSLIKAKFDVSQEDIDEARKTAAGKQGTVFEALLNKNRLTENQLLEALGEQYAIPIWKELPVSNLAAGFTKSISIKFLKKFCMIPLSGGNLSQNGMLEAASGGGSDNIDLEPVDPDDDFKGKPITIAMNNPAALQPLDDLVRILQPKEYQIILASKDSIISAINMCYDHNRDSAEQLVQDMEENGNVIISEIEYTADLLDDTSDAPIIKLVNHILSQSIKARASDIHFEPYQNTFKIRYRVDGILYDLLSPPIWIQPALISRVKVMAKMNIAEKRLPQDGRFEVKIGDQDIDVRVATLPTSFGERLVLRLLNKSSSLLMLPDLGLSSRQLGILNSLVRESNGVILVTGPTGSGKTTTLYAVLMTIKSQDINIITIEDPIEYQIRGISQIQVNPKINLTFARGLRSIVRQDPDVILVGEIRDRETADIAVQSALTGHRVFSTLHTNDSASAITRLVDIGIEPFLISSSVIAVVAQRLVRVLCEECREPYIPEDTALESIGITTAGLSGNPTFFRARGCHNCFLTGYRDRIGIFEIMVMESDLKNMILKNHDSNRIKKEARSRGMTTLRQDGIQKVLAGTTTIEEIVRVTQL